MSFLLKYNEAFSTSRDIGIKEKWKMTTQSEGKEKSPQQLFSLFNVFLDCFKSKGLLEHNANQ